MKNIIQFIVGLILVVSAFVVPILFYYTEIINIHNIVFYFFASVVLITGGSIAIQSSLEN